MLYYKTIAACIIFIISLIAIIYPFRNRATATASKTLELGESFASGVFLGVALFHMLPEARAIFQHLWPKINYPFTELICSLGFVFFIFLERCSMFGTGCRREVSIPYLFTLMLAIHSLIEGTLLGLNINLSITIMIFIAIIAHKGAASFALCVTLMRHQFSNIRIMLLMLLFALATPLGILGGAALTNFSCFAGSSLLSAGFNAGAAGSFLYMSILHHIQFHQRTTDCWQGWLEFFLLLAGLVIMALIAIWV